MLTYSYRIQQRDTKEYIKLNDFYISPDLSYISGTTNEIYNIGVGDTLWVSTPYYPEDLSVTVSYSDIVKRNGYILVQDTLPIKDVYLTYYDTDGTYVNKKVKYVEYNGNVCYQNMDETVPYTFKIDGEIYSANPSDYLLTFSKKIYVDDNKVTVDGITYNVLISDSGNTVTFSDSIGNYYSGSSKWDVSNVVLTSSSVQKLRIDGSPVFEYGVSSFCKYGYKPYIIYNNDKVYLDYLTDESGYTSDFGVTIDNIQYPYYFYNTEDIFHMNVYDKDSYNNDNENDLISLPIDGAEYEIYFEPSQVPDGDIICFQMEEENLPILIGDKLNISLLQTSNILQLSKDLSGNSYVFYDNEKYYLRHNLCDKVLIGESSYELTYSGDCENLYSGMTASATLYNNTTIYFKIIGIEDGKVKQLQRVKYENGKWTDAYTICTNESGLNEYVLANNYFVENYDGITINNVKFPVISLSGDSYIELSYPIEYRFEVVDTIGSNKILCKADIKSYDYGLSECYDIRQYIASEVESAENVLITKRENTFGIKNLTVKAWSNELFNSKTTPISVYELSDVYNNIKLERKSDFTSIRIPLSKTIDNSLNSSNLIMNYHYDEEADKAINRIVDMDKDIYLPVYEENEKSNFIERVTFNLHFRTRDLETWEICENNGTSAGLNLSIDNDFCNWFVTDYYPYNQYSNSSSTVYENDDFLNNCMNRSDLLGYLYFTTDDVQTKRKKLSKSFLRLTYYDSKSPTKQNMLGTSTIFMDFDHLYNTMYDRTYNTAITYVTTAKSIDGNRLENPEEYPDVKEGYDINLNIPATVLNECFKNNKKKFNTVSAMYTTNSDEGYLPRLDSRLVVSDRYETTSSSEGFYAYILKEFADKEISQRIYMKAEFFHAGKGIKIPMVIATDSDKNAIKTWNKDNLEDFKEGYSLDEIYDRLYIPLKIKFDKSLRKFVYEISNIDNYENALRNGNELIFNLFELKTKAQ